MLRATGLFHLRGLPSGRPGTLQAPPGTHRPRLRGGYGQECRRPRHSACACMSRCSRPRAPLKRQRGSNERARGAHNRTRQKANAPSTSPPRQPQCCLPPGRTRHGGTAAKGPPGSACHGAPVVAFGLAPRRRPSKWSGPRGRTPAARTRSPRSAASSRALGRSGEHGATANFAAAVSGSTPSVIAESGRRPKISEMSHDG